MRGSVQCTDTDTRWGMPRALALRCSVLVPFSVHPLLPTPWRRQPNGSVLWGPLVASSLLSPYLSLLSPSPTLPLSTLSACCYSSLLCSWYWSRSCLPTGSLLLLLPPSPAGPLSNPSPPTAPPSCLCSSFLSLLLLPVSAPGTRPALAYLLASCSSFLPPSPPGSLPTPPAAPPFTAGYDTLDGCVPRAQPLTSFERGAELSLDVANAPPCLVLALASLQKVTRFGPASSCLSRALRAALRSMSLSKL